MVKLSRRKVEVNEDKVVVNGWKYDREIDALPLPGGANPDNYALIFGGDEATSALSMQQQLSGMNFHEMNRAALEQGLSLARAGDFTPLHRDVNLALQGRGVLYDASGNLIDGNKLVEVGKSFNGAWGYLNDAFKKSSSGDKGFLGLDITHVTSFNGDEPIFERQPLEECVVDCWADTEAINGQGFYTKEAPVQKFEQGKTVYVHKPIAGRVARFGADSGGAYLGASGNPLSTDPTLGGFLRAEGTSPNSGDKSK